jgi:hypothetical protein
VPRNIIIKARASADTDALQTLGAPATAAPVALVAGGFGRHVVLVVQHFVLTSVTDSLFLTGSLNLPTPQVTVAPAHRVASDSQQVVSSAAPQVEVAQYKS